MTYQDIIKILQKHDHHFDGKQLNKAIKLLLKYCHNNKYSLEILETLISIYPDTKSVIISLLFFSSVKDNLKLTHIKHHFGEEIATIFFSLAELFRIHDTYSYNTIQETFQLFCSLKPNITIRVLLIRFAYLLHKIIFNCTISDIGYYLVSEEIKDIYVPLFKEITVGKINNELQNVCLEILQPHSYKFITDFLKENYQNPDQLVIKVINSFHDILSRLDLAYIISGRVKSTYSIAQKLVNKSNKIKHLCDIIGIRVIVEQDNECYQVLNTIFNNYPYAPDRNKDFIKFPKENNYQSLHAVIIYKDSRKLEVQIRTRRMHNIAQYGSASHLQYKMNLQNGNNLDITYNILNKLIFNTLNQYTIHSILPKYLRIYNRSDGSRSYIIEPIKPNKQTLKQDVLIYYENTLYRYKSQVYTEHGIDLDLDIKSSVDRLQSSPNIYVIPAISHQVLFGTNYQYNYEVIINYQEYNVEIVVRQVLQRDNTTHAVWQLPSEQIEYNLPRSNISLPKQTVPIVNIMHTSKHLMDKVSNFTKDLLQKNVRKFAQQKIHYAVDSNKLNTKLLTHPSISIAKGGMCIAHSTSIKDGDLPFLLAVHNGNLEIVEKFFTYPKLDIYQINQNKEHALIIATQLGNIEMLRLLISYLHKKFQDNIEEFEGYLNLTNSEDQSALYFAFDYFGFDPCRSIEMIKILLSITNQDGYSLVQDSQTIDITAKLQRIFFQEVLNGNRQIVEKLITITKNNQLVIDINKSNITDEYSGTALLMAINMQDSDMVQLLLTHPNISIAKGGMCIAHSTSIKDGDLPFLLAVHNGNLEIVEKFFTYPKLDIYQINQNKEHALIIATQLGNIEMLRLLISYLHKKFQDNIEEFKRYLNLTNSEDQSALYFAFDYFGFDPCRSIEMIKILLSITNQDGYSLVQDSQTIDITAKLQRIFFQEVLNGNRQIVEKLITITKNNQLVIDINKSNITDEYSGTALLMAINMQDSDMVQLLLTHPNISIAKGGMCIAHSTSIKDGDLPFLLAVHNGNLEIVEKFFTYPKLDIYQINQNKEHALIIATQLGNIEMLRLLISYLHKKFQDNIEEFERYLNLTNSEDQSALYFAFDYFGFDPCRSIEMIKILLSITNQDGYPLVQDSQTIDITAELQRIFFQEVLNGNRQIVEKLITITKNNQLVIDINKSNITDEYSGTALLMAINMQDSDMVQLLLTHPNISIAKGGMCIAHSTSIKDGDLPFLLAVHNGNLEIVEKFFTYPKLDIYQINQNKEHALIIATQLGNIEMLRLLISYLHKKFQDNIEEFERYLNLTNSEDQSALYFAFDYFGFDPCRSIEMIKILLSITNQDGYPLVQDSQTIDITAKLQRIFFQEVLNGNRQIVEKLITITKNNQLVIDINKSNITDEYSGTALLMAINMQDSDMVQLLLTHPNISIAKGGMCIAHSTSIKDGDLPFLLAVHNGNLEIVEKFFTYPKLDIYQINQNKEHALIIATQLGNIEMLRLLISYLHKKFQDNIEEFERYLNLTNSEDQSALYFAFDYFGFDPCRSIEMIKILLSITNQDGYPLVQDSQTIDITAKLQRIFFQEVLNGNRQIVEKLITITKNNQLVIDINKSNITDEYSGTALLMAINMQDSDMVQLLLTHPNISIAKGGMCIAHSTSIKDGDLPFLLAVHNGNLEIVEKFFTYPKLDIYQINQNKEHALIIATQLGNIEMLRLLISYLHKKFQDNIEEFERYLNLTNSEDQSALYFAFDYFGFDPCRSIEMIKILLSITNQDGYPLVQDSQTIDITAKLQRIFFQEVLNGNRQIVEKLITITKNNQLVIDINKSNITDEYSGTALLMAINMQDSDMVQLLLTHPNIDINRSFTYQRAANINGDIYTVYPFLEALSSHNRIIDLFLKYLDKIDMVAVDKHGQVCVDSSGEIIITRNQNGESALMIAIKYGNIDILTRLIDTLKTTLTDEHFKQYLNYVEPFEGNNVLTLAGQQGHQVIAQALIGLKGKDGVPLININHQDFYGNRVQHYFNDDEDIQYEFRQYATQDFSTKTLQTIITNPQSTHYADEEAKKCISALQEQFQDQLTEQHIGQSVEAIHNYLDKLHNDRIFCLDSFGHSTISIKIKCITTTNVNSVSHNIAVEVVPKVVKYLLQKFDINLRKVLHLAWLMIKHREKTDNPQNFNFTIDLIKNLTQAAFEYTKDDVKELNVETMKQACPKGICNILISSAMPTVSLVNYDEGEKAPGYFAQNPERVREYLHATTEYTQGEIFTAAFRNKWQKMLNEFCPNYTNDDKIVWDNEPNKLNVILDQSEFLDVWSEIMEIINDLMNNENNWNQSNITQILEQQYHNVIMIHQKIEEFLQKQPQLLQTIKNSELYPIMHLVSNNQDCDIIANIVFMFVVHNADIEMAQSLIAYKNKDGTPLIQAKYAEMAEDVSDLDQGIEREHPGMLQVFLLVEYLYTKNVNQNKAEQLLRLCDDDNKCLVDTEAADVILKCLHKDDGSTHESAEDTIIHEKLGISEHTHLLGDV